MPYTEVQRTTTTLSRHPINKWWPIGLLIAWILLFIIGGALIGAYNSSVTDYYDGYGDYYVSANIGLWNGGVALLAIGGIVHFAFGVVAIIWFIQYRRTREYETRTVTYVTGEAGVAENDTGKPVVQEQVHNLA